MKKEIKIAYFPSDTLKNTVLTSNGTILDNYCTKCETEENIETGNYILDATFTLYALDYLDCENILKVKMDYGDEVFKISKVTIGTRYIDIVARQITIPATLCLYLDNVRPTNTSGQGALSHLLTNAEGLKEITLISDITTIKTAYYEDMSLYNALHDSDNSFINRWGGEVLRRGYTLSILKTVGIDRGVSIREGKNLTGFNGSSNLDNLITKARGKGFDGIKGNWISSPLINSYASVYQKTIEFSDVKVKGDNDTEGYDTLAQAQTELDRRISLEFSENDIDKIKATYEINFVQLEKTEEYKNYTTAERTYIGDTIRVYVPKVKCDVKVRAIIKKYDVLSQKTKELKVSNAVVAQAMSMNGIISDLKKQYIETNNNSISSYIDAIIKAGLKDSHVVIRDNELLAMDTKDINTATKVTRLNMNGLAFSSTGYYGHYDYGFTIDGVINANMIGAGMLSTIMIQNKDGSFKIDLSGTGGANYYTNGKKAMAMVSNKIDFFNHGKNGDYIGSIGSINEESVKYPLGNPDKPSIGIWNDIDSNISIGYKRTGTSNKSYIEFDKYQVSGVSASPIRVSEGVDFLDVVHHYSNVRMYNYPIYLSEDERAYIHWGPMPETNEALVLIGESLWVHNDIYARKMTVNGADYAELFEWLDGNTEDEDRVGYIVALEGENIVKASGDDVLGIISATPSVVGDASHDNWNEKYLKDKWGRNYYETIEAAYDENGNVITPTHREKKLNPCYDEELEYIPREQRKEWDKVGLLGKLICRDDGTSSVGDYVTSIDGIATKSNIKTRIRVMKRIDTSTIKVFVM